jgi:hypothetical protein
MEGFLIVVGIGIGAAIVYVVADQVLIPYIRAKLKV